jgi:hypothetical protein
MDDEYLARVRVATDGQLTMRAKVMAIVDRICRLPPARSGCLSKGFLGSSLCYQ